MLTLWGVAIVAAGFLARFNPLLVVTVAAIATGLLGGLPLASVVAPSSAGSWVGVGRSLGLLGIAHQRPRRARGRRPS